MNKAIIQRHTYCVYVGDPQSRATVLYHNELLMVTSDYL